MRNSKKLTTRKMVIFMLVLLVLTVYFVSGTYARYTWKGEATGTLAVAKWQVGLVKGEDKQSTDTTVQFTINDDDNVVDNKIAPSYTATGELVINPEGSEVAIDYELVVDQSALSNISDKFKISKIYVNGVENTLTADGKYSGTINLVDQSEALTENEKVTVKFEAYWEEDGSTAKDITVNGYGSNKDTLAGKVGGTIDVPVTVYMNQHVKTVQP